MVTMHTSSKQLIVAVAGKIQNVAGLLFPQYYKDFIHILRFVFNAFNLKQLQRTTSYRGW